MGKLYKRGETYYADYYDRSGKRQQRSTRTSDIQVARARLRELELATTDRAAHATEAVSDALAYFLDVSCASKPRPTVECYQQKARHVNRLIGETPTGRLDSEAIERYIAARLDEGASRHSVHKEMVVLRSALERSRQRERGGRPDQVPKFRSGYVPRTSYLTPEQFMALSECLVRPLGARGDAEAHARRKVRRTLYCLLITLASPRSGEIEALRWEHVDLARGVIRVPKGKTIARSVAIHPVLRPWLERYHEGTGPIVERWGNVRRDLPAACLRAGVPRCTPNDLRRTFASWLVQAGETLYVVSRLLGHKSTRMVEMVYGQLDDATLASAIQRMPGGSHAGVTHGVPNGGTGGVAGTTSPSASIANSVEESTISSSSTVPRDGIEPPTRGFSVPVPVGASSSGKPRKLRLVS